MTAFSFEAGAQTLSVTDNSPGRAVMIEDVTVPSANSEAIRISLYGGGQFQSRNVSTIV